MNSILYIASFENLRFKGGIYSIATRIMSSVDLFYIKGITFTFLSSCQVSRKIENKGKWKAENFKNVRALKREIRKEVRDKTFNKVVVNTSNSWAFVKDIWICRFVNRTCGLKTSMHIHYSDYKRIMPPMILARWISMMWLKKYVDQLIFLNTFTQQQFVEAGYKGETFVVPNFYNIGAMYTLPMKSEHLQLLYVGTIDQRKGFDTCLSLIKEFKGKLVLRVTGEWTDADFKAEMTQKIIALKLDREVVFEGFVAQERMTELLEESDVLLLFSQNEGMSIAMLDAMHAGLAIMPSNIPAHREVFVNSEVPLFDLSNFEKQSGHLRKLLNDKEYLIKQKEESRLLSAAYSYDCFVTNYSQALLN